MPQLLILLSVIIILGSLFYYLYALTNGVILIILAIVTFIIFKVARGDTRRGPLHPLQHPPANRDAVGWECSIAGPRTFIFIIILAAAAFYILFTHQTTDALRSPWEVIPPYFFLLYGATVLMLIILYQSSRRGGTLQGPRSSPSSPAEPDDAVGAGCNGTGPRAVNHCSPLIPLTLLTFLTLSVSTIIFPLGAGFDPFIHQATEKIIAATGTLTPKPLYYIGQYVLVVFLSKISGISVAFIDKLLVPLLAAIFIPLSIKSWIENKWTDPFLGVERGTPAGAVFISLSFLLLPFLLVPFTSTTPYSLALLFLLVLIFNVQRTTYNVQLLIAAATLLIHPLVGIPAFIFVVLNAIKTKKRLLLTAYCLLAAIAIPAAFLVISALSSQVTVHFAPQNFLPWIRSLAWSGIYRENRFNAPLDLLYFYGFNIKNIYWFFIITGMITLWRSGELSLSGLGVRAGMVPPQAESEDGSLSSHAGAAKKAKGQSPERHYQAYLITPLILLTSYSVMSGFLSFNFLIDYEQSDYAKRVLDIAQLFLLPLFLLGINWWFIRIPRFAGIMLLVLAVTASLYLTYPQKVDSYAVSRAYNTSQADIDAVRWIDADAHGEEYIVLANQAVSAAAVRELGFKKYFLCQNFEKFKCKTSESIFLYPIPTNSPLYKFYLKMVYENATAETLREAIQLVGAQRGYFILNRYWNDFDRIFAEAQQNLALVNDINDSVFIFTAR